MSLADVPTADLDQAALSTPEEIVAAAREGKMFILVDREDRENEGDLIIPAQMADANAVNFMAKHARGLICLAMTGERATSLDLSLMAPHNASRLQTAFTVSIEAREGVTTGISAADRARTIAVAIDPASGPQDIVSPGHVFPLVAKDGGVLERAGHTEAGVDIARMAGLTPAAVICEIMNDDGTMARLPELISFAQLHGLKIGTISDLIAHRRRTETLIERVGDHAFTSAHGGDWTLRVYANRIDGAEYVALIKGAVQPGAPTLVRMHVLSFLDDVLARAGDKGGQLHAAMREIDRAGAGVVVVFRQSSTVKLSEALERAAQRLEPPADIVLRDYGVGAQILLDLGVRDIVLLTNSSRHKLVGLDGFGLNIVSEQSIPVS